MATPIIAAQRGKRTNRTSAALAAMTRTPEAEVTLKADDMTRDRLRVIHKALLIGLSSYGEIERLDNEVGALRLCHLDVPQDLFPIHPTGAADTAAEASHG